jgi:hypothetical protein
MTSVTIELQKKLQKISREVLDGPLRTAAVVIEMDKR